MTEWKLSPLFTWRSAIVDSDLEPTTRHVALTLSLHMNERGGSCFPSIATLVAETGLAERTVQVHLRKLRDTEWLRVKDGGGRGRSNTYTATIPAAETPHLAHPSDQNGAAGDANPADDAAKPRSSSTRGRQEDDKEDDLVAASAATRASFETFWQSYPRRNGRKIGKGDALARWSRMSGDDRVKAQIAVEHYRAACEAEQAIAMDAHRWLKRKLWNDWAELPEGVTPLHRPGGKRQPEALPEDAPTTVKRMDL